MRHTTPKWGECVPRCVLWYLKMCSDYACTDPKVLNFYRACHVVMDNIPTMLRELLLRKLASLIPQNHFVDSDFKSEPDDPLVFKSLGAKFEKMEVQPQFKKKQSQWDTLWKGEVSHWDTSFLRHLLCDESKLAALSANGRNTLLDQKEHDAVTKLKDIRNESLCHLPEAKMSNDHLRKLVDDVKRYYDDLSGELTSLESQTTKFPFSHGIVGVSEEHSFTEILKKRLEDIWTEKIGSEAVGKLREQIQEEIENMREEQEQVKTKISKLHENQEQVKEEVTSLGENLNTFVSNLEEELKCLNKINDILLFEMRDQREDINGLKEYVDGIKEVVDGIKENVDGLKHEVGILKEKKASEGDNKDNELPELTAQNAINLLRKHKFSIHSNWSKVACTLGVSLEERKRLRQIALLHHDGYFDEALEESLTIWIKSKENATWDELIDAVRKEEKVTADAIERELRNM